MQKKKIWIRFKGYHPSLTTHPFHYRLRWRLGRFFSVKKDVHLSRLSDLWQGFDYDFWPKKLQQIFREWNCRYCAKRLGKQEGCLSESWLFVWWVFLVSWEKKLKIATFTEAPFMVKSEFWNNKYFFSNICAMLPWLNIWNSHKHSTWPFSCLIPMENCAFCPPKCIWNIWTLIKWGAHSKNLFELFGGRKNERQNQRFSNGHL